MDKFLYTRRIARLNEMLEKEPNKYVRAYIYSKILKLERKMKYGY